MKSDLYKSSKGLSLCLFHWTWQPAWV